MFVYGDILKGPIEFVRTDEKYIEYLKFNQKYVSIKTIKDIIKFIWKIMQTVYITMDEKIQKNIC